MVQVAQNVNGVISDEELVRAFRDGKEWAFSAIFKKYWFTLYEYCARRINAEEDAKEIVQLLFLELWERRERLFIAQLEYFLKSCIQNKCIDYMRSKTVEHKYQDYYRSFAETYKNTTAEAVELSELAEQINSALNAMNEKSREIFNLSRFEGLNTKQIAIKVNLSEKTVQYHLTKSLKMLRVYLRNFLVGVLIFFSF